MLLPDTSIWVAYLRAGSAGLTEELSAALDAGEVLVCGPVLAELAAGARAADRPAVLSTLAALPWADLDRLAWQAVGLLAAELRSQGEMLPLTDLEIAVAAQRADATLWTTDRHFERLAAQMDDLRVRFHTPGE